MPNLFHKCKGITDLVSDQEIKISTNKMESKQGKFQFTCRRVNL